MRDSDEAIAARIDEHASELLAVVEAAQHPHRLRILLYGALCERAKFSPVEVATDLAIPLGVMAYHFRTLSRMHLVRVTGTGRRRGAIEHYYSLTPHGRTLADRIVVASGSLRGMESKR